MVLNDGHGSAAGAGYIDKSGKRLFAGTHFLATTPFSEGISIAMVSGSNAFRKKYVLVDRQRGVLPVVLPDGGEYARKQRLDYAGEPQVPSPFSDGLALLQGDIAPYATNNSAFGYIDKTGHWAIPPGKFRNASSFHEGLSWIAEQKADGQTWWGAINTKGELVIPLNFSNRPSDFSDGMARVRCHNGLYGYVDKTGSLKVPCQYTNAGRFADGFAFVATDTLNHGPRGLIDKTGTMVRPLRLTITDDDPLRDDQSYLFQDGNQGFMVNAKGEKLMKLDYITKMGTFRDGFQGLAFAEATVGGQTVYGLIDIHANFVVLSKASQF